LAGPASSSPGVQALRASLDCIIRTEVDLDNINLGDYVYYIEERCLWGPVRWRHQMPSQPSPSEALFRIYVQKPSPRSGQVRRPDRGETCSVAFYSAWRASSPKVTLALRYWGSDPA
jgi:hypothetical protein